MSVKVDKEYAAAGATVTVTVAHNSGTFASNKSLQAYESDGTTTIGTAATITLAGSKTGTATYNMTAQDTILVVG